MDFIAELRWRGLLFDMIPGTESYLAQNKVAGYLGVDPTSNSMHIGNLVAVMMLVHLQRAGHKPIALVGGATGMVGDPSGKDKERQLLSLEEIQYNVECTRSQLEHFLDFETEVNPAEVVNNYDWFGKIGFLEFLRDVGKHITISYMLSKESVKKRLESDGGISYTEFAYQLLQGYDYYWLYKNKGVQIQVGGSDQWGNITTGTELIRRLAGHDAEAFAVVCPLLTREDGSKFGKTAGGQNVWLDPERTSPYQFYQYWVNSGDEDAEKYIRIFTLKGREEVEGLIADHRKDAARRRLQKAVADDITLRVHGEAGLAEARLLTDFFFGRIRDRAGLEALTNDQWIKVAGSSDVRQYARDKVSNGLGLLDLMVETGIASSKGDARRAIEKDRAVKLNMEPCPDSGFNVTLDQAFHGRFIYVQRGKKNKFIIELV